MFFTTFTIIENVEYTVSVIGKYRQASAHSEKGVENAFCAERLCNPEEMKKRSKRRHGNKSWVKG